MKTLGEKIAELLKKLRFEKIKDKEETQNE